MILECPACAAKFKIPDGAIPPGGRKVRCANCKHSWHAEPTQIIKAPPAAPAPAQAAPPPPPVQTMSPEEVDAGAAARAAAIRRQVQEEVAAEAPPHEDDDDMFDRDGAPASLDEDEFDEGPVSSSEGDDDVPDDFDITASIKNRLGDDFDYGEENEGDEEYEEGDFVARRRAEQRRQAERAAVARKRKLILFGWVFLVLFWLVTLYSLVFMRETVVKAVPGMAGFYEMFEGVSDKDRFRPEDGETLTPPVTEREVYVTAKLYNERTRVETIDGRPILMVRGFVENTGTVAGAMAANVPQVQVDVLDRQGRILETVVTDPPGFALRRGTKLDFETQIYPIPAGAVNVSVKVLEGTRSRTVQGVTS